MSAVIADPPAEVKAEVKATEAKAEQGISFDFSENLKRASRAKIMGQVQKLPPDKKAEEPKEEKKEEPVKADEPKKEEAKKEEAPKDEKTEAKPMSEGARANFAVVEKDRDAARDEAKALKAELDKLRAEKPAEQDLAEIERVRAELEAAKKESETFREKLRSYDVQADPDFERQYTQPIKDSQAALYQQLVKSGVSQQDAAAAINEWNDDKWNAITGEMSDIQKRRIDAMILDTEKLNDARVKRIGDPATYEKERQQRQSEERARETTARTRLAEDAVKNMIGQSEHFQKDERLRTAMLSETTKAARGEIPVKDLLNIIAARHALEHVATQQDAAIVSLESKVAELTKENEELNKFVKANGAMPRGEAGLSKDEPYVPTAKAISVQ